ncbi:MAG: hypothetical protein ACOYXM_07610 [Actinomycetota bacterium]
MTTDPDPAATKLRAKLHAARTTREAGAALGELTRHLQGLPRRVTNPVVLDRVAALLGPHPSYAGRRGHEDPGADTSDPTATADGKGRGARA